MLGASQITSPVGGVVYQPSECISVLEIFCLPLSSHLVFKVAGEKASKLDGWKDCFVFHLSLSNIFSFSSACSYGMRYIAKVLKSSLHDKFPDATEDELLKVDF